jgi:hypothetical protein
MANPCAKILTNEGVSVDDATRILEKLRNRDSFESVTKEIANEMDLKRKRELSDKLSKAKTTAYTETLTDISSSLKKPFKRIFDILANGKTSIANMSRSRVKMRMNSILAQTGIAEGELVYLTHRDESFQRAFLEELFDFNGKQKTKNKQAFALAESVHHHQTLQIKEANLHGAGMGQLDDYVTKQWHDLVKIMNVGSERWIDDILKNLDTQKTIARILEQNPKLKGIKDFDLKEYLASVYQDLTKTSSGQGILLDTMRLKRILAFKDADSLIRYNSKYGHKNLTQAVFENMEMMDNHIAFGEVMGYGYSQKVKNPKHGIIEGEAKLTDEIYSPIVETKKTLFALKELGRLTNTEYSRLSAALKEVSGDNYVIGNPTLAKMHSAFVGFKIMTSLGKATISSILDISSAGIFLHYQGIKPGQGYYGLLRHAFRSMTRQIPLAEKQGIYRMLKVGADGAIMSNASRYTTGDLVSGAISEGANAMFHLNGLNMWTNMMREGYASMSSMHLANNLDKTFAELPELWRKNLTEYGIRAKEWKELQKIGSYNAKKYNPKAHKTENYVTSDWLLENGGSQELANKLDHYYINESRLAIPEADASDRAIMFGNHNRGTVPDVVRRMFFMFRTHQVNQARNLYPRMFEMGLPSIMHVIPAIGLGYTSIALKNLAVGKEPPNYKDPQLLVDSLIQSGYAPIFGDFLAGEYGRYRHDFDESVLGAGYSSFKDWGELFAGLLTGDKTASDGFKNLRYNIPYANLFYTEAALNYGLHYGLMESVSPGYLNRLETSSASSGSEFMFAPSNIWSNRGN